jgi:Zc3h12a-like Ribonuclease NYN domain
MEEVSILAVLPWEILIAVAVFLGLLIALWLRRRSARPRKPRLGHWVLVDGSNVMHWKDKTPQIDTVRAVVRELQARGLNPAVVFDANAGWKLQGRYQGDREFAKILGLPLGQVYVVPKGEQADPYLLATARDLGARVVSNDRFRDWAGQAPEVATSGFLIRGGERDGRVWVEGT